MKKRLMLILLAVLCVVMLAACGECDHEWEDATCEEPKTCSECGETKGKANGHSWVDATCEEPKTCSECGETKGKADGHDWVDATYDAPKTCSECGATEGEPLERPVERPANSGNLGITYDAYVKKLNTSLKSEGYELIYLTDTDDGYPIYGIYTTDGDYLDVFATFEVGSDEKTVISLLVATMEINDSDKVYVTGFVSGVAWALTNRNLTSDMVSEMLSGEPQVDSDGTVSYYMENNGWDYYMIVTTDMVIFSVGAE